MAHEQVSASSASTGLPVEEEARWADATVQQCLNLCSNVDMIYNLLIQEIQPVLGKLGHAVLVSLPRIYCLLQT